MIDSTGQRDISAVDRFAIRMRQKLSTPKNAAKPHWNTVNTSYLLGLLREEMQELVVEMTAPQQDAERVADECVDVAAVAMMICDVVGGLNFSADTSREVLSTRIMDEVESLRRLKTVQDAQLELDRIQQQWGRRFGEEERRWTNRIKELEARVQAAIVVLEG